jgi:uncharacterized delta-60 repeat protein
MGWPPRAGVPARPLAYPAAAQGRLDSGKIIRQCAFRFKEVLVRSFVALPFALFIAIAAACGNVESADPADAATANPDAPSGSDPDATTDPETPPDAGLPDALPDAAPGDFYISTPEATFVRTEGQGTLSVTIERGDGFQDAVTLAVTGLPRGVTVAPATIAADATSTTLRFTAAAAATIGAEASLTVTATSTQGSVERSTTARLTVAGRPGTLDTTFGDGGILVDGLSSTVGDLAENAFLQGDGRIVTVGNAYGSNQRFGVTMRRYLRDGTLDRTFGNNGTATETFGDLGGLGSPHGHALAQSTGHIIVVGAADIDPAPNTTRYQYFIRRYTNDGRIDSSFSGRQLVLPAGAGMFTHGVVGPNDELLLAGTFTAGDADTSGYVVRLSADGDIDSAFGSAGVRTVESPYAFTSIGGLVAQPGGTMLVALVGGNPNVFTSFYWIVRLGRTGTPDSTFASDGKLEVTNTEVRGLGSGAAGTFFAYGGTTTLGGIGDPYVLKFDAAGRPAAGFGNNGVWNDSAQSNVQVSAFGLATAGELGAGLRLRDFVTPIGLYVWNLTAAGALDPSFATGGILASTIPVRPSAVLVHDTESRVTVVGGTVDNTSFLVDQTLVRIWK